MRVDTGVTRDGSQPNEAADYSEYSGWIKVWFALDAVLALFPPIYWVMGDAHRQLWGVPLSLLYFVATAVCIAASIVTAYFSELGRGNFAEPSSGDR